MKSYVTENENADILGFVKSVPRVCGGDPQKLRLERDEIKCSPRMRG